VVPPKVVVGIITHNVAKFHETTPLATKFFRLIRLILSQLKRIVRETTIPVGGVLARIGHSLAWVKN